MKRVSVLVTVVAMFFLGFGANAQTKIKLAHVNSSELVKIMPGVDSAQKALQDEIKLWEETVETMNMEFEKKKEIFLREQPTMSKNMQDVKMGELQDLMQRIENTEKQAQSALQDKHEELFKPIIDRMKKAIEEVAKENGYNYVFDSGGIGASGMNILLYSDDSDDIMNIVKKKLGIK